MAVALVTSPRRSVVPSTVPERERGGDGRGMGGNRGSPHRESRLKCVPQTSEVYAASASIDRKLSNDVSTSERWCRRSGLVASRIFRAFVG